MLLSFCFFFFFNDTATTEIYTLSLHDALPICLHGRRHHSLAELAGRPAGAAGRRGLRHGGRDRKSTRLNSSHLVISYAVFCLKKKKNATPVPPDRAADRTQCQTDAVHRGAPMM